MTLLVVFRPRSRALNRRAYLPGADAPGFMLTPASQVEKHRHATLEGKYLLTSDI